MRYRGGKRGGYASRLHYFSEWIADGERRGLVRDLGTELGGVEDGRPLRFMTSHRDSYPALADEPCSATSSHRAAARRTSEPVIPTAASPASGIGSRPGICWPSPPVSRDWM